MNHHRAVSRLAEWFAVSVFVGLPIAALFGEAGLRTFVVIATATGAAVVSPLLYELMQLLIDTSEGGDWDDSVQ